MIRPSLVPGAAAVLLLPASLAAQTLPIPLDNSSIAPPTAPTSAPTVVPLPLPAATPTALPTPRVTPTPRSTPAASPTPRATPASAPAPTPTKAATTPEAGASPTPRPTDVPTAGPDTAPSAAPSPRPTIETVVLPQQPGGMPVWPWLAGGAVLLLGLAALLWRRRAAPEKEWPDAPIVDAPEPPPEPPPEAPPAPERPTPSFFSPTPAPPAPAALDTGPSRLAITLRPTRAGLNMMTATVEADVTVANIGDVAATGIRANVLLFGASHADEPDLARIAAAPVGRPAVPAFTLAEGADRRFRAVAALPLNAIVPLHVGDRRMFVPIVIVHLRWTDAAGERAAARAWAVGVERADAVKLAPLWLDTGPQSFDQVGIRPHGNAIGVAG